MCKKGVKKMREFQVGYAKVNINSMLGIGMMGYYIPRYAKGFLDDLEASALALSLGDETVLLVSVDTCLIFTEMCDQYRKQIEVATGISHDRIFLSASHTHTGPLLAPTDMFEADEVKIKTYADFLGQRLADVAQMALTDRKNAKMGFAQGWAPERVACIRRYKMKNGTTMTCPPVGDPNIDYPLGELDQRVHVLRFDQEKGESIVLVNYGIHTDTVNGELISADFPGWMRRTLDKALDGVKCMFFPGAQGDVGSTHVFPSGGDMNDTQISFDNEMKSPGMARFVGRALAGTVLQVYDKVEYVPVDRLKILHKTIQIPANVPAPEEMPRARLYKQLHDEGHDDQIPYSAMELTTVVAEACRMCALEHGPESFSMDLTGLRIGPVALIGVPSELFTQIGARIKDTEGWSAILPCSLVNGSDCGYIPTQAAYDEGGYEARSAHYKAGVDDIVVNGSKALLDTLKA